MSRKLDEFDNCFVPYISVSLSIIGISRVKLSRHHFHEWFYYIERVNFYSLKNERKSYFENEKVTIDL